VRGYSAVVGVSSSDPTLRQLRRGAGALATAALQQMDERLPWYRAMPAEERSWVGLVAQAGIAAFITWYRDPGRALEITADVFGTAPRELTGSISLQQTLELLRTVVDVVEDRAVELAAPGEPQQQVRESVLRYSREVAFAAAEIYARAAEARGAWDARLEALVVDALVRGEADDGLRSRAAALGWNETERVAVMVGATPAGPVEDVVGDLRRAARSLGADALVGVQGDRVVVVLGRADDPLVAAGPLAARLGPGPVVTGPVMPSLVDRAYRRLVEQDVPLLDTVAAYLDLGRSIEGAARALFVHPNTVRYRLKRVCEITGWDPTDPREGFVLQVAIAAGRLAEGPAR